MWFCMSRNLFYWEQLTRLIENKGRCLMRKLSILLLLLSQGAFAVTASASEYFIKFTTSGGRLTHSVALATSTHAWMDVSVVDAYPTDGPVHYPGSQVGATTRYTVTNKGWKTAGVDYKNFYFAKAPRSISIRQKSSSGGTTVITHGNSPVRFTGAPSFLMPDQLVVATGMSITDSNNGTIFDGYIHISAAMPMKMLPFMSDTVFSPSAAGQQISNRFCAQGWSEAVENPGLSKIRILQSVMSMVPGEPGCVSTVSYYADLSHVILFE